MYDKAKDIYNKFMHSSNRKMSLEVKQFRLEEHLKSNPTDYTSVIANERLKSDIIMLDYKITEIRKRMEVYG